MANEIASYFVRDSAHWSDSYDRVTDRWHPDWIVNRASVTGGVYLGMPLTILTSGWTFSAAEGLAYGLRNSRDARIVGEATGGGAHVVRRVVVGNGYLAFVPYTRSSNLVTKTDWEGTGVAPTSRVPAADALLTARELILRSRMATISPRSARDTASLASMQWAIDDAIADAEPIDVSAAQLARFAGRFEEYEFFVKDGRLYSRNTARNGKVDRLRPITPTLFAIDRESHAVFVAGAGGPVTAVRILWNDGWIDTIKRARPQP